jgi:hypothetical protein
MQRGYAGVAGRPVRSYPAFVINAGSDCWLQLTFLDGSNNLIIPTTLSYRIDNLTTDTLILADTPLTVTKPVIAINIPGAINIIDNDIGQSSQLNQVKVTTTYPDSSVTTEVFIYEIIAIQVVGG